MEGVLNPVSTLQERLPASPVTPIFQFNLFLVNPDPEFSSLIQKIFYPECEFYEIQHSTKAKAIVSVEAFEIAILFIREGHLSISESLDLINHLVDRHPDILILLYSDLPLEEPLKRYQQRGIIDQISTFEDQTVLIQTIAKRVGIKDWKKKLLSSTEPLPVYRITAFSSEIPEDLLQDPLFDDKEETSFESVFSESLPSSFLKQEKEDKPVNEGIPAFPPTHWITPEETPSEKHTPFKISDQTSLINFFILEVAHKIKNPLVAIKTFTELLKDQFDNQSFRKEFYPIVRAEIGKIDQTVESLMEYSEHLDSQTSQSNLLNILENQVTSFNNECRGNFKLKAPSHRLHSFLIDESKASYAFSLLFTALIENSGKHSEIEIQVESLPIEPSSKNLAVSIKFFLPTPSSKVLKGLDMILAKGVIESLNGQVKEDTIGNLPVFKVIFYPLLKELSKNPLVHREKTGNDRRQYSLPLAFKDRRKSERRQKCLPISFGDRRGSSQPPLENESCTDS